ncbi:MAG: serine phosphatase RsbU (regulator of sigma subunit) [Flammeovirgaceae bacterium]|jgi:sigma-B regulation protein RsbU (phosphoserine phosphatase)
MTKLIPKKYFETASEEFVVHLLAFTIMMSVGGIIWGIICSFFGFHIASVIPYGYVVVSLINLLIWYQFKAFKFTRFVQVLQSISLPFLFQWLLGGFSSSGTVMLWAVLALTASITFHKASHVVLWLIYFLALTIVTIYLDDYFYLNSSAKVSDVSVQRVLLGINISVVSSMIFALAVMFISNQRKVGQKLLASNNVLDSQNDSLEAKQSELEAQTKDLEYSNQQLLMGEEEIRQTMEELTVTNEKLEEMKKGLEESILREWKAKEELKKAMTTELAKKSKNIISSLNYARRIQRLLMPNPLDIVNKFSDAFILLQAKDVVSGDFFWYEEVKTETGANKQILVAADCTGHGVPGALMSMIGLEQLTEIVNVENIYEANELLNRLHSGIKLLLKQETSQNKDGMDIALCVIDKENRTVEYAGAKNPLVYIKNNKLFRIKADRQPIGSIIGDRKPKPFTKHTITVDEPTTFYLFSDGFQDQFGGEENRKFLTKRFRDLLLKIHQKPMRDQKKILAKSFASWKGDLQQTDDVLVIGFRV